MRSLAGLDKALIHNNYVIVVIIVVAVFVVRQQNAGAVIVALEGRIVLHRFLVVVVATAWLESGKAVGQGSVGVESQSHEWQGLGSWWFSTKKHLKSLLFKVHLGLIRANP